jgi:TolB-like protein
MKKFMVLIALFAAAAATFAQTAISLDTAMDNCAAQLRNQLTRGARVAILRIEARTDEFSEFITDSLSAKIVAQNYLAVVERGRTLQALDAEQSYQMSGNVSDETATSIGKQLGAELIITGSIVPRGDYYSMNIRVVHVETAQIQTQWMANAIWIDPSLVRIDIPTVIAIARFAGTALEISDQDSLIQDIQRALGNYNVAVELISADEAPANTDYNFLITLRVSPRTDLQVADLTFALRRGSRVLKQSDRHTFSEFNMEYIIRKSGQVIQNDQVFFQSLPGILANQ